MSSLLLGSLTMAASVPAFAESSSGTNYNVNETPRSGNVSTYNGPVGSNHSYTPYNTNTNRDGVYSTRNNANMNRDGVYPTRINDNTLRQNLYGQEPLRTYNVNNVRTNANRNMYRATATTTTTRGFSWGWLGLIGLFGLAGMRSRSRDDVR